MEIWKDITGYEGLYQISSFGRVKSFSRLVYKKMYGGAIHHYERKGRFMLLDNAGGYFQVQLSKDNIRNRFKVHRLVAMAFIPNPLNKPFINHFDNNRQNNSVENLEWCTSQENALHCARQGRTANNFSLLRGSDINTSKLNSDQVLEIRISTLSNSRLGEIYGVSKTAIRLIKIRKNWAHV